MPSFKNFRNRGGEGPPNGNGDAGPSHDRPVDGPANRRYDHRGATVPASDGDGARAATSSATELGPEHLAILRQIEAEGEPLSLAEELAEQTDRGDLDQAAQTLELLNKQGETHIAELQRMSMPQLIEEARRENLTELSGLKRQDLIFRRLKERVKMNGLMFGEGTLEMLPDGFGFLRSPDYHCLSCLDDI